jgi:hypothetical protein
MLRPSTVRPKKPDRFTPCPNIFASERDGQDLRVLEPSSSPLPSAAAAGRDPRSGRDVVKAEFFVFFFLEKGNFFHRKLSKIAENCD